MKNFDLIKIRKSLPHGAITEIAEKMDVDTQVVSDALNKGWHKDLVSEIVSHALVILKRSNIDPEVVKEATAMKFTTDSLYGGRPDRFRKKKRTTVAKPKLFDGGVIPIVIALAVGAFLLFGKSSKTA
jgi:hypothetical protein